MVKETKGTVKLDAPVDEQAMSEAVKYLFNFPEAKLFSWTRWRKREIPLIASLLTQLQATNPNRPKYLDAQGNETNEVKPLSLIYLETVGWLRLAEEGAMRNEGMAIFQTEQAEQATADAWKE